MKKLLLLIFILNIAAYTARAQKKKVPEKIEIPAMVIDEETKYIVYEEVIKQEGAKDVLYDKALAWAMKFYKSPSNVLLEKAKEAGKIIAMHRFNIFNSDTKQRVKSKAGVIEYTLTFLFKDGKYKYKITRINLKQTSYKGIERWYLENQKEYNHRSACYLVQVTDEINKVIDGFKATIARKKKAEEEW